MSFEDFTAVFRPSRERIAALLSSDAQLRAFLDISTIASPVTFGVQSTTSDPPLLFTLTEGSVQLETGKSAEALFTLSAPPAAWERFFEPVPSAPFQSYWGMLGEHAAQNDTKVLGDSTAFVQWAHVWRSVLELLREVHCGPAQHDTPAPQSENDQLTGRYLNLTVPSWGKSKAFYETSGEGKQPIVFLHTEGGDGREFHGVMNDARMRKRCAMYALDLPGHGRSRPMQPCDDGAHRLSEDIFVTCIAAFIKAVKLRRPIVCGGGAAGQACLDIATRHKEVGVGGAIPLQAYVPDSP